jgi:formylglycine-generating enzyme required for sulfatase activity
MKMAIGKIALPENMEFIQQGSHGEIVRRWFALDHPIQVVIGIYMNWFVFDHLSWDQLIRGITTDSLFGLVPALLACGGIWLIYTGAAGSLNRTRISISPGRIAVRHGPLPWPGNRHEATADLKQLHLKTKSQGGRFAARYEVHAFTRSGKALKLVGGPGLNSMQASYILQELEKLVPPARESATGKAAATDGLVIRSGGSGLDMVQRWVGDRTIGMSVFAAVWLAGTGYLTWAWHTRLGTRPAWPLDTDFFVMPLAIDAILLAAGLLMAYRALAEWLNRTRLTVNRQTLSVRHGPVPWPGNIDVAVADIRELHVKQARWGTGRGYGMRPQYKHEVHATMADGRSRKLVGGFATHSDALHVSKGITQYLGLRDAQAAAQSSARATAGSRSANNGPARVMASLLGLLAIAGGLYLMAMAVPKYQTGASLMSQVILVLAGAFPLSIGILLFGAANRLIGDRVAMYLFATPFGVGGILFLSLAIFGTDGGTGTVYVTERNVEEARAHRVPAGVQLTPVVPGRLLRDCDDCPEMVEIPAGSFAMGADAAQEKRPVHTVTFARPFALARTEITQGQWRAVMGNNPSYFSKCGDTCPVERISRQDAQQFVRKLGEKTGQTYRLPSEAEWEYACRAGGSFAYCSSDNPDSVAQDRATHGGKTYPVASRKANAFGLYDMNGNVWEWTEDCWHDNYAGAPGDGSAWVSGESCSWSHVLRGGSWHSDARVATERGISRVFWDTRARASTTPAVVGFSVGLRPVRTLP